MLAEKRPSIESKTPVRGFNYTEVLIDFYKVNLRSEWKITYNTSIYKIK